MSSCWEIIRLKINKVRQMVSDTMSQEPRVHHETRAVHTRMEMYLFLHTYIQGVLHVLAFSASSDE